MGAILPLDGFGWDEKIETSSGRGCRGPAANATMSHSMAQEKSTKPRVGVPWRTLSEETQNKRPKIESYLKAVEAAGGEPVLLSLETPVETLHELARTLDAFVLPGSPADVDPLRYGAARHPETATPDGARERMDFALLDHALEKHKPVLAICYGTQLLNVYMGGSLVQDIPDEVGGPIRHDRDEDAPDSTHPAKIEGGHLAKLTDAKELIVNSSHHQSVRKAAPKLKVTAHAPDGIVEAVEYTGPDDWVVGVQWHPERIDDTASGAALSRALFKELMTEARKRRANNR
jgi:putative glutamine amidotransferase